MLKYPVFLFSVFFAVIILVLFRFRPLIPKGSIELAFFGNNLLYPDLIVFVPEQIFIENRDKTRKLRFNTKFTNLGDGNLHIVNEPDVRKSVSIATQLITDTEGKNYHKKIGEFTFHPQHRHWHIDNFVRYQLWTISEDGQKDKLLSSTEKVSFCLWDNEPHDLSLSNAPKERKFSSCNSIVQGLSVGWIDNYNANIEGQELDVQNISDGIYFLVTDINPDRNILESNYNNNEVFTKVEINGTTVKKL